MNTSHRFRRSSVGSVFVALAATLLLVPQIAAAAPTPQPSHDLAVLSPEQLEALAVQFAKCDPSGSPTSADATNASILNGQLRAKLAGHMNAYRVSCARMIVQTVRSRGLAQRAAVIAITTAIVESGLQNYATAVDHDSLGLFQQRPSQGWGTPAQIINPTYATNAFLNAMLRKFPNNSWMTTPIGEVCQRVQVSAFPERYQPQAGDAQIIVSRLWNPEPDRLDVFARGADNQLIHTWYKSDGDGWRSWEDLGGNLTEAPDAASWEPGRIDVFARGADNHLIHTWYKSGDGWRPWNDLAGDLASSPGAVSWGRERVDVFARGVNNQLVHTWWKNDGNGWRWQDLGGDLTSGPDASSWESGRVDVYARGVNNQLVHAWYKSDGNGWRWQDLGGNLTSDPTAISWGRDRVDVFARGVNNQLVHTWYKSDGNGWRPWEDLGGNLTSAPDAASWAEGRIDVFARGVNNQLVHTWYKSDGNGWRPWEDLGGHLTSDPTAISWN